MVLLRTVTSQLYHKFNSKVCVLKSGCLLLSGEYIVYNISNSQHYQGTRKTSYLIPLG